MQFTFKNIDEEYQKGYSEKIGDIQPKYWFWKKNNSHSNEKILVKRQHSIRMSPKSQRVPMFNHFGEVFAYILAKKANIQACPVEMVILHDTKNKYTTTKNLYPACASHYVAKPEEIIYPGEIIVNQFRELNSEWYQRILSNKENENLHINRRFNTSEEDNVDIILAAIQSETQKFEEISGKRSPENIQKDIEENLTNAIEMIVFDCILGNSDRHSQNWSMVYNNETGSVKMYPMYDNEAILGLREVYPKIKEIVNNGMHDEEILLSRMGVAPMHSKVTYKTLLTHLIHYYPKYSIPAIKKIIDNITIDDLQNLYDAVNDITKRIEEKEELTEEAELPKEYKLFGMNLFEKRIAFAKKLVRQYQKPKEELEK